MNPLAATFTAQTPEQARLLLDFTLLRPLGTLMKRPSSVAEVAQSAELTVKQAHHKVTRLRQAGLVWVTDERPRAGRPIKVYSAAPEYHVPFHLTSAETVTDWVSALQEPFIHAHLHSTGKLLSRSQTRHATLRLQGDELTLSLSDPDHPGDGMSLFTQVRLTAAERAELQAKLRDIRDWIQGRQAHNDDPAAQECLLGLLLTTGMVDGL